MPTKSPTNIDLTSLTLSFNDINTGSLPYKVQSGCAGYSATKDSLYILGGDIHINDTRINGTSINYGLVYNFQTKQSRILSNLNLGVSELLCSSQNYMSFNDIIYIIQPNIIITFNMISEQYSITSKVFLDSDDDTATVWEEPNFALCTDYKDYLFIVSQSKLYVLSIHDYTIYSINSSATLNGLSMNQPQRTRQSCAFANNHVYVVGGFVDLLNSGNINVEKTIIDLSNNGANMGFVLLPPIQSILWGQILVPINNEYFYIIGGVDRGGGSPGNIYWFGSKEIYLWNSNDDSYSSKGSLLQDRLWHTAILRDGYDGKIYVMAGYSRIKTPRDPPNEYLEISVNIEESSASVIVPKLCGNQGNSCFGLKTSDIIGSNTINSIDIRFFDDDIGSWTNWYYNIGNTNDCTYFRSGFTDWFPNITCNGNIKGIGIQKNGNDDWILDTIFINNITIDIFSLQDTLLFDDVTSTYYAIGLDGTVESTDTSFNFPTNSPTLQTKLGYI